MAVLTSELQEIYQRLLIGQLIRDLIQSSKNLWVEILLDRYVTSTNILHSPSHSSDSLFCSYILYARDVLKDVYSWHVGSVTSYLWSCPLSYLGFIGTLTQYIDIHDLHLTVKDVISSSNPRINVLYTQLPPFALDTI